MPNHKTRTCTVLSTTGHIIRLSSAITGTRHWKKITPEQMHIYYSFPAPLLPFIPPILPGAAAAQSLSLHMHPASCHAHPAHSLCPLLPFSLSPPTPHFAVQSASHLHSHPVLFFISLHTGGENQSALYTPLFAELWSPLPPASDVFPFPAPASSLYC